MKKFKPIYEKPKRWKFQKRKTSSEILRTARTLKAQRQAGFNI